MLPCDCKGTKIFANVQIIAVEARQSDQNRTYQRIGEDVLKVKVLYRLSHKNIIRMTYL